ncbi:MAG: hypothetical protein EZS28_047502, partial [Streblomastix strix]
KEEDFEYGEWQTGIKLTKNVQNPFVLKYFNTNMNGEYTLTFDGICKPWNAN